MAIYPFWWDKTITIYNRISGSDSKVTWQRTVLTGCFWKYVNQTTYVNNVKMTTKEVICRIPKKDNYVPIVSWLDLADHTGYFTLRTGDVIFLGEVTDEVDDYEKGKHMTDVLSKYKAVNCGMQIETFTDDTGDGLCCEHYNIAGI